MLIVFVTHLLTYLLATHTALLIFFQEQQTYASSTCSGIHCQKIWKSNNRRDANIGPCSAAPTKCIYWPDILAAAQLSLWHRAVINNAKLGRQQR